MNNDGDIMMRALSLETPLHLMDDGEAFYRRMPEGNTSLSGRRFTAAGLKARIEVMARIGRMLARRDRLDPHRPAFDLAFELLAADCRVHRPELEEACHGLRGRYGSARLRRAGRPAFRVRAALR